MGLCRDPGIPAGRAAFASGLGSPDGLERVAEDMGFLQFGQACSVCNPARLHHPLPGRDSAFHDCGRCGRRAGRAGTDGRDRPEPCGVRREPACSR